jgi:hypothetical protein
MRVAGADSLGDLESGILAVAGAEDNFVIGVVLAEEAFEVLLELGFHAVQGLEDGDEGKLGGGRGCGCGLALPGFSQVAKRADDGEEQEDR